MSSLPGVDLILFMRIKSLRKHFLHRKKTKKLARIDLGIILSWSCFTKKSFGNPEFWKLQIFLHTFHSIIIVFTSADFIFLSAVLNSTVSTLNMVFVIFFKRFGFKLPLGKSTIQNVIILMLFAFVHFVKSKNRLRQRELKKVKEQSLADLRG